VSLGAPKQVLIGMSSHSLNSLFVEVYWADKKIRLGVTEGVMLNEDEWALKTLLSQIKYRYEK